MENCQQEHFDLQQRLQTLSINDRITDLPDIPMELRKEIWYVSLYLSVLLITQRKTPKLVSCILTRAVFFRALFKDENTDAKDLLKRKKESLQQISQKLTTLKA